MTDPVLIDELPAATALTGDHVVPSMHNGQAQTIRLQDIIEFLLQAGGAFQADLDVQNLRVGGAFSIFSAVLNMHGSPLNPPRLDMFREDGSLGARVLYSQSDNYVAFGLRDLTGAEVLSARLDGTSGRLSVGGQDLATVDDVAALGNQIALLSAAVADINNRPRVRAWVNFDGTGTPTVRGSFNVASISRLAVGSWRINMAAPRPDANYAVLVSHGPATDTLSVLSPVITRTASSFDILLRNAGQVDRDTDYMGAVVIQ